MNTVEHLQNSDKAASLANDRALERHTEIIRHLEMLWEMLAEVKDKSLRNRLAHHVRVVSYAREEAECLAMGPEWSMNFLSETLMDDDEALAKVEQLFSESVEAR